MHALNTHTHHDIRSFHKTNIQNSYDKIKRKIATGLTKVSTWIGDRLWAGKPSRYVTATEVDSAFYPLWDGKMTISFRAE